MVDGFHYPYGPYPHLHAFLSYKKRVPFYSLSAEAAFESNRTK